MHPVQRIRSLIIRPLQHIVCRISSSKKGRRWGIMLYQWGLWIALAVWKRTSGVLTVYSKTAFDTAFAPGYSDIDLVIVAEQQSRTVRFLKRFHRRNLALRLFLPFLAHTELFFQQEFKSYQKIMSDLLMPPAKRLKNWQLLYGTDQRESDHPASQTKCPTRLSSYLLQRKFENLLVSCYEALLVDMKNHRRILKPFLCIKATVSDIIGDEGWLDRLRLRSRKLRFIKSLHGGQTLSEQEIAIVLYSAIKMLDILGQQSSFPAESSVSLPRDRYEPLTCSAGQKQVLRQVQKNVYLKKLGSFPGLQSCYWIPIPPLHLPPPRRSARQYPSALYFIMENEITLEDFTAFFSSLLRVLPTLPGFMSQLRQKAGNRFGQRFPVFASMAPLRFWQSPWCLGGYYALEPLYAISHGVKILGQELANRYDARAVRSNVAVSMCTDILPYGLKNMTLPALLRPQSDTLDLVEYYRYAYEALLRDPLPASVGKSSNRDKATADPVRRRRHDYHDQHSLNDTAHNYYVAEACKDSLMRMIQSDIMNSAARLQR